MFEQDINPEAKLEALPKIEPLKKGVSFTKEEFPDKDGAPKPRVEKHVMTPARIEALAKARAGKKNKAIQRKKDLEELEELRRQNVALRYHDLLSGGSVDTRFMTREDLDQRISEIPKGIEVVVEREISNLKQAVSSLSEQLARLTDGPSQQSGRGTNMLDSDAEFARKTTSNSMNEFLKQRKQISF